jgi:hypothetical protein
MAYAQRQMRLKAATDRLGQLYGQDPTAFNFRAPSAYAVPGTAQVPNLGITADQARAIASNLSLANVNTQGGNPTLYQNQVRGVTPTSGQSYFQ